MPRLVAVLVANLALRLLACRLTGNIHPDEHAQSSAVVASDIDRSRGVNVSYKFHGAQDESEPEGHGVNQADASLVAWEWGPKRGLSFGPARSPISAYAIAGIPMWIWVRASFFLGAQP